MKTKSVIKYLLGSIFGGIGLVFLLIGLLCVYQNTRTPIEAFRILGIVFTSIGAFFSLAGALALLIAGSYDRRLRRLKRFGDCYPADIHKVSYNPLVHVNYRHPLVFECGYFDRDGRSFLVRSGNVWLDDFAAPDPRGFDALVWVNRQNPRDYAVEITSRAQASPAARYDYDYR